MANMLELLEGDKDDTENAREGKCKDDPAKV